MLGAVFLQLCKVLRLEEHPIVQKPVDPSLFIDKFTQCKSFMSLELQVYMAFSCVKKRQTLVAFIH